jgi:hypothetical protein
MNIKLAAPGAALVALSVAASALSSIVHRDASHTNDLIAAFPIELLAVLGGGMVAWVYLQTRRYGAPAFFGVAVYLLAISVALSTPFPSWLPTDNAILGAALLAGLLAADGASLTLASSAALAGWSKPKSTAISLLLGVMAFAAVTAGGVVAPLVELQVPLLTAVMVAVLGLVIAGRARTLLFRPLLGSAISSAATVALLLARGPGDWSSASTSLKLYSLPIVTMACGVSLLILATTKPSPACD